MNARRPCRAVAWARAHPLVMDGALGVLLAVLSLIALFVEARAERLPPPGVPAMALVLLISLPLVWRRRHPFWANLVVGAGSAAYGALPLPDLVTPVPLGGVVALYSMAAWSERRKSIAVGALAGVALVFFSALPSTDADVLDFSFTALLLGSAWVLGDSARVRRAHAAELEARADWLARERDYEARRAVTAERARIARELHDVIAHHVSMMVVQAEAGPVTIEHDPARAAKSFDTISEIGRQAMVEMRRLLGVLRADTAPPGIGPPGIGPQGIGPPDEGSPDEGSPGGEPPVVRPHGSMSRGSAAAGSCGDTPPGAASDSAASSGTRSASGSGDAQEAGHLPGKESVSPPDLAPSPDFAPQENLAPQPGIAELPDLIDRVRLAGLRAELNIEGTPVPLSAGADTSAYRIVQEALTNAVKHAGRAKVEVNIRYDGPDLRIEVHDDGFAVPAPVRPTPGGPGRRGGHGLIGMRERAHLFGGELTAGPDPRGGFTVAARLPIGASPADHSGEDRPERSG